MKHKWQEQEYTAMIPMRLVGPVKIISAEVNSELLIPLATLETPLWPSTHRGAKACNQAGGITAVIMREHMTRSIVVTAASACTLARLSQEIVHKISLMQELVRKSSNYAQLVAVHPYLVGSLLYIRFSFTTGDAAGHNMATLAANHLLNWLLAEYSELSYVSISGNFCTDKKVSAVNSILGRGKHVVAEVVLTPDICQRFLKTTPLKLVELNVKKNLLGSIVAGSVNSANAHFANILLGFYLATGQDVANIVEGSQGIVHTELRGDNLYFSVTLPNIIVGTVGSGKHLPFVQENLRILNCLQGEKVGHNARCLAIIAAAAVLCGELSLLAAQTNPSELMRSHLKLERVCEL